MHSDPDSEFTNELSKRLFEFSVNVLGFLKSIENSAEGKTIRYQLAKSSCSSGANYEEAQAGSSKADFSNKVRISLREMRESNYWLRLLKASSIECDPEICSILIQESGELKRILGAIAQKTRS
jgi:four helix bundle protein